MNRHLRRPQASQGNSDAGFSLIELIVTMMIIGSTLLGLVGMQVSALVTTTQAKQRQQATALGNQVLEQLRSLPFALLSRGLNPAGLTTDPNVTAGVLATDGLNEVVVADNTGTDAPPLAALTPAGSPTYNQVRQTDQGSLSVTYDARSYVSRPASAPASSPFNLTVIVTWASSATRGRTQREVFRSAAYAPTGCLSTTTRPFSGPCQAYFYADAALVPGSMGVSRSDGGNLVGASAATALTLPLLSGSAGIVAEQTTGVTGRAVTSGALRNNGTTVAARSGEVEFRTLAGDDPANVATAPVTDTDTLAQTAGAVTVDGALAVLTATPATSETGSLISTAMSAGSCQDIFGDAMSAKPCGNTTVQQSTMASIDVDYKMMTGRDLPPARLAEVAAASSSTAWSGRYVTAPGTSTCTTVSGAGCIAAGAKRSLGTTRVGFLPAAGGVGDVVPSLPDGLVNLTNYADEVGNESGTTSSSVPQRLSRSGSLRYVRSDGVTRNETLTPTTSLGETLQPATATYATAGVPLVLTVTGTVAVSPAVVSSVVPDALCAVACVKQASMPSVLVTLTYALSQGGAVLDTFDVKVNLGDSRATTTYKAAPSA